ncbi:MAG: drug/metabolite transporter (DMT)-like permease [Saprospiraceae bacterium]|jgi:drug/metabolite transporter (DMT)-like permease
MKIGYADYLVLFLLALLWGSSFGMIKIGVNQVGPLTLVAGRIIFAAFILYAWMRLTTDQRLKLSPISLWHYWVVGLLGHSVPFALISWGEMFINSSTAAVLMGVMPIVTVMLAHFFLKDEPFKRLTLVGVCFGFSGLIVLVGVSTLQGLGQTIAGEAATVLAAISYASVTIFVRRNVHQSGIQIATGAMILAAIASLAIALIFESPMDYEWNSQTLFPIIYLGVFPTAIASLLYFKLVRKIGATNFSQVNYMIPLVGSGIGVMFMGEQPHLRMWIALCLILTGITLVRAAQNNKASA